MAALVDGDALLLRLRRNRGRLHRVQMALGDRQDLEAALRRRWVFWDEAWLRLTERGDARGRHLEACIHAAPPEDA